MADKITFDRAGAGIVEKKQWQDAESLGQIGASAGRISSSGVAVALPGPGGSGPQELTSAVDAFNKAMSMVILEYIETSNIADIKASLDTIYTREPGGCVANSRL